MVFISSDGLHERRVAQSSASSVKENDASGRKPHSERTRFLAYLSQTVVREAVRIVTD